MTLSWLGWAIALTIGFPLLTILSGFIGAKLRRKSSPYRSVLHHAQNLLLPMTVLFLFSTYVLDTGQENLTPRILLTITLLSALYVLLAVHCMCLFLVFATFSSS